ncbi:Uncharacterized [Moorella glycerini]|uniref:Type 4 fimbrial biogenesis protein PilX N-terminal domain-containing protein n=1 Tax=Neomoorella stamsii TaxID=1266720 RepID=A0A9X7J5H2_9FIRM|nr:MULTISPECIES: hypothetical protein [Moorella]PRR77743.1 hypothetical protein MOST_00800 [Moorella stamsii]CEP66040.1 Uncharacterized [Moorella glycerini]
MVKGNSSWQGSTTACWYRRGSALPGVLLAILVLSLLGAGLLSLSLVERQGAANEVKITQATYLAEAGINLALANLRQDPGWQEGLGEIFLPRVQGRIVSVSLAPRAMSYRLRSVGEVDGIKRALEVELARPFFSYALASAGDMTVKNPLTVNGDLFAAGSIYLQKGASGNVAAGMDLTIQNNTIVQGSVVTGRYLYNYGTIRGDATVGQFTDKYGNDPNYYGRVDGQIIKGLSFSFPAWPGDLVAPYTGGYPLPAGEYTLARLQDYVDNAPVGDNGIKILYCNGDLIISNWDHGKGQGGGNDTDFYTGKAIIAAAGDITLSKDIRATAGSDAWAFVAGNDIILDGGVTVDVILVSERYFYKQGAPSTINGSLVTGGIEEIEEDSGSDNGDNQGEVHGNFNNEGRGNGSKKGSGNGYIKGQLQIIYENSRVQVLSPALAAAGWQILSWRGASLY